MSFLYVSNLNGPFPFGYFGYFRLPLSGQTFNGDAIVAGWGATVEGGQINGTLLSAQVGPAANYQMQVCVLSLSYINMEGPPGGTGWVQNHLWRGSSSGKW